MVVSESLLGVICMPLAHEGSGAERGSGSRTLM
jgi:hypothetical protein